MSNYSETFHRQYDLTEVRRQRSETKPASHQQAALGKLSDWFQANHAPAGGIVALPTGGGKTFVAVRFLCEHALSQDYKVLWLAHTHHLLEQAFYSFVPHDDIAGKPNGYEIGRIAETRTSPDISLRVVSGTPGHYPAHQISAKDDIIIGTLQTLTRAHNDRRQQALATFLNSSGGKLVVVFDEAHHSPAPSYRKLLLDLRESYPAMYLLGLTATPTYTDERRRGWLKKLFPQDIIQVNASQLMANNILAKPILEEPQTHFTPDFDDREYQKWVGTYRDLPEDIIAQLAASRERNAFIADTYIKNKQRYGKTIVFASRWFQCVQLEEMLKQRGVRAGSMFSHVDADPGSVAARNRRDRDENTRVLAAFRRGELDVLINIRMLTEGTDVPDAQTAFLTRQTTSKILMTQMVGRVLRGPEFGGTEKAYIVAFIDDWQQAINWAGYDQLAEGLADETIPEYGKRPPLHLISIDLVQRLSRQMDSGLNINPGAFRSLMPLGWYRVEFQALAKDNENIETVRQLVMVFDDEKEDYETFIEHLMRKDIDEFAHEQLESEQHRDRLAAWKHRFFQGLEHQLGGDLLTNLFHIARHVAQNEAKPRFFFFEARDQHDLDKLAVAFINQDLGPRSLIKALEDEYHEKNRYWRVIYPTFGQFKSQYDACVNWQLGIGDVEDGEDVRFITDQIVNREPSQEVKAQVKQRDGYRCLCCGEGNKYRLQIDHIKPSYYGGSNQPDNLQTLCKTCNRLKATDQLNFRSQQNPALQTPPDALPANIDPPAVSPTDNPAEWETYLRRTVNFFYRCAAVQTVTRGDEAWRIKLHRGNNPGWLKPHLKNLAQQNPAQQNNEPDQTAAPIPVIVTGELTGTRQSQEPPSKIVPVDDRVLVAISRDGLIRGWPVADLAHGETRMAAGSGEPVEILLVTRPADTLLFFTNQAKVYAQAAQDIPAVRSDRQGTAAAQVLSLAAGEKVTAALAVSSFDPGQDLMTLTRQARIKRTALSEFSSIRSNGLSVGVEICQARCIHRDQEIIVVTRWGQAIRFQADDVPQRQRTAGGVIGMRLNGGDKVVALDIVVSDKSLLVVTNRGFAKRTLLSQYRVQRRSTRGMRTLANKMERTGEITAAAVVSRRDDVILVTKNDRLLRIRGNTIAQQGRATQGSRVITLQRFDTITAAVVLASS